MSFRPFDPVFIAVLVGYRDTGLRLSANSFPSGSAQNTAIGTLTTVGGKGTYTYTLTDSHGNAAQVAGSALQVGPSASTDVTFSITVLATSSAGSAFNFTKTFILVAWSSVANSVVPTISGSAIQGVTLTADPKTWTGYPAPGYTYQWERGGVDIAGGNSQTYVVQNADVSSTITVTVTGSNGYSSANATSIATAVVTKTTLSYIPVTTGQVGVLYTGATPTPSDGTPGYTYSAVNLPGGLSVDSGTGVISGTPVLDAIYTGVVLTVMDANGVTDSSVPFTITISAGSGGYAPSLDFSDERNSQYIPLVFG
jgi:hypothetical protein